MPNPSLPDPPGRVAGIDYGTVRIGIALSDPRRTIASPVENYTRRGPEQDARRFRELAAEERVALFVVGLPVHLDGRESEQSTGARQFGQWLADVTGVRVEFFDERFSTLQAEQYLLEADMTPQAAQEAPRHAGRPDHAGRLSRVAPWRAGRPRTAGRPSAKVAGTRRVPFAGLVKKRRSLTNPSGGSADGTRSVPATLGGLAGSAGRPSGHSVCADCAGYSLNALGGACRCKDYLLPPGTRGWRGRSYRRGRGQAVCQPRRPEAHLHHRGESMIRRSMLLLLCAAAILAVICVSDAPAQEAYNRQWGRTMNTQDWNRFYHYPYVYYPQNFWGPDYYRSSEDLYFRYPPEMRIPVYNQRWQNYYPVPRAWHNGGHFSLDTF